MITIICAYCKKKHKKHTGHVNRAISMGNKLYCSKKCSGIGRRHNKTVAQKKKEKAEYDLSYRDKNEWYITQRRKAYEKSPAGRAMQKRNRDKFKQFHLEYCRTPEYRKWKHDYDQKHVAKKKYGEFDEVYLLSKKLKKEIDNRQAKADNELTNKTQKRKRLCKTERRPSRRR